jgi:hypothetical protein
VNNEYGGMDFTDKLMSTENRYRRDLPEHMIPFAAATMAAGKKMVRTLMYCYVGEWVYIAGERQLGNYMLM